MERPVTIARAAALALVIVAGCYDDDPPSREPDVGGCVAADCASLGVQCGPVSDGCGGVLECGACPQGQTCGGGGAANMCGTGPCVPTTCEALGASCGAVANGCGGVLECGTCPQGQTCGGGGAANVCGTETCTPATCEALGATCGPVGDGCGAVLDCGSCPEGETCGAGGEANQCGTPACTPATCESLGATCGSVGDGCGGMLDCGACPQGQTCGGGGTANQCGTPTCTPFTCQALGATCGSVSDACGGMLECGTCPEGQICGGGGANRCGAAPCVPVTCDALGAECGPVGNGCGGMLDCGSCPEGETCGGGGEANRCAAPPCTPTTCEALGAACGSVGDGCSGTLDCGGCPEGQTCGGGGTANQCGAPPGEEGGATRWALDVGGAGDEHVAGVAVREDGLVVALTVIGGTLERPDALGLVWISPEGRSLESPEPRTYPFRGRLILGPDPVAVSETGDVFIAFGASCEEERCTAIGGRDVTSGVLVKLSPEGEFVWRADLPNGVASNVAADAVGGAVVAESFADAGMTPVTVRRYRPNGSVAWTFSRATEARAAVAVDPDGNVVVGQEWTVVKLDANGAPVWTSGFDPTDAFITSVGVAAGAVVVAGSHGDTVRAGSMTATLPEGATRGAFLAAFGAEDGAPAWVRSAGPAELLRAAGSADVELASRSGDAVALLVGGIGCDLRIERWAVADGTRRWTRGVDAPGCDDAEVFSSAIDVAPAGDVVAGGGFRIAVDFGRGRVEPAGGRDGFVLDLAP